MNKLARGLGQDLADYADFLGVWLCCGDNGTRITRITRIGIVGICVVSL